MLEIKKGLVINNMGIMEQKAFPKFEKHSCVECFCCNAHIGHEIPQNYGFAKGSFGMWCDRCKFRTYYDTDDQSIKFDRMGYPLKPTCSCGCTIPYGDWPYEEYSGFHMCPNCGMV
jgi:hypothetical protein